MQTGTETTNAKARTYLDKVQRIRAFLPPLYRNNDSFAAEKEPLLQAFIRGHSIYVVKTPASEQAAQARLPAGRGRVLSGA